MTSCIRAAGFALWQNQALAGAKDIVPIIRDLRVSGAITLKAIAGSDNGAHTDRTRSGELEADAGCSGAATDRQTPLA